MILTVSFVDPLTRIELDPSVVCTVGSLGRFRSSAGLAIAVEDFRV